MRTFLSAGLLALALFPWSCQRRPRAPVAPPPPNYFQLGERYFEAGDYPNAAQAYETYLRNNHLAANRDRVLFRLALAYALPGSPVRDLPRAMQLLQQLVDMSPQSPFKPQGEFLLRIHQEVDRLRADVTKRDERIKELNRELEKLNRELEKLKQIDMQRRPSRPPP